MNEKEIRNIISDIQASPKECEWVEVKGNNYTPELIGEYISALANGAAYMGQSKGYLVFGIQDGAHTIIGTTYQPKQEKIGNEEIENNSIFTFMELMYMSLICHYSKNNIANKLIYNNVFMSLICHFNMKYKETVGNTELLKLPKTAFLCSRKAPASAVLRCYDWALDFIINYDIKYRMGKELEGEDE